MTRHVSVYSHYTRCLLVFEVIYSLLHCIYYISFKRSRSRNPQRSGYIKSIIISSHNYTSGLGLSQELLAEGVINITVRFLRDVEEVSLVGTELNALLDSEDQVRVGDEWSADTDDHVVVLVLDVDGLLGGVCLVAASYDDGSGVVVGLEEEVKLVGRFDISVSSDAGLDDVRVGQLELGDLLGQVSELRDGVCHAHALEGAVGAQTDTGLVGANSSGHSLGNLEGEPGTVLNATTPGIRPLVAGVLVELVDEVAVGGVDLDTVEARFDSVLGSLGVVSDEAPDLLLSQGSRGRRTLTHGDGAAGNQLVTL